MAVFLGNGGSPAGEAVLVNGTHAAGRLSRKPADALPGAERRSRARSTVRRRMVVLTVLALAACALYLTIGVNFDKPRLANYDRTVRRLLLGVTLAIAVTTALVGPISFLGLIIANLARQALPTYRHGILVTGSALVGMVALVAGQMVSERVFHLAVPVSTFISIAGGAYFLFLLLRTKQTGHA